MRESSQDDTFLSLSRATTEGVRQRLRRALTTQRRTSARQKPLEAFKQAWTPALDVAFP